MEGMGTEEEVSHGEEGLGSVGEMGKMKGKPVEEVQGRVGSKLQAQHSAQ